MITSNADLSESIRVQLNKIPEKDQYGNEQRFRGQIITFFFGLVLMGSRDKNNVNIGTNARNGAIRSFVDLILDRWMGKN